VNERIIYWTLASRPEPYSTERNLEADAERFLSVPELDRLSEMRFPKRRGEWLLGRWTAKNLAVQTLPAIQGRGLLEFSVLNHPKGAPFFASLEGNRIPAALSISHRDDRAFCAVCTEPDLLLGVDLERIEPRSDGFVTDYYTENEQDFIRGLSSEGKDTWVTASWSMKESVLKALGLGLRVDTRQVEMGSFTQVEDFDPSTQNWEEVDVRIHHLGDHDFHGYWRCRDSYVLTLVWGGALAADGNMTPSVKEVNLANSATQFPGHGDTGAG
jgi:4'-phosphopantetheinyl transferase